MTVPLDDGKHDLTAEDPVRFDGRRRASPRARTEATALVVLAPATDRADDAP